jgi:AdoMet-dependent heme synthase
LINKLTMCTSQEEFDSLVPKYSYHVVWHVTNLCNVFCQHCSSNSRERLPNELNTEEGFRLLDDLHEVGVLDLALSGGEPLLRQDIFEFIRYARKRRMNVGLGSSGSTINDTNVQSLKEAGITTVQISLDGVPDTHDLFRGVSGIYERAISAINSLVCHGIQAKVCFTANRLNYKQMGKIIDLCADLKVNTFNLSQYIPVGRGPQQLDLNSLEWKEVYELWAEKKRQYSKMLFTSHTDKLVLVDECYMEMPGFIGCQAGTGLCAIRPNGDVIPCVFLPIDIGNIRDKSFREIWDSSDVVYNLKHRNIEGHCGSCDYKYKCGGCRAAAYAYSEKYLSEDPRCWMSEKQKDF